MREFNPSDQTMGYCEEIIKHINEIYQSSSFTKDQTIEVIKIAIESQKVDVLHNIYKVMKEE